MRLFELTYRCLMPFVSTLHYSVHRRLMRIAKSSGDPGQVRLLDAGGRKSHYTIGVPAGVTIMDLPREKEVQHALNLGITTDIVERTKSRRSNIEDILFDDMTRSGLPNATFDFVVSVEVLEHVEQDGLFVSEVSRVLKPGGTFLMTTPNGDFVKNTNPDHKRHYSRAELVNLLESEFEQVEVEYAVKTGRLRRWGLRSWSLKRPWQTTSSAIGNILNTVRSASSQVREQSQGTHHLIALARKPA